MQDKPNRPVPLSAKRQKALLEEVERETVDLNALFAMFEREAQLARQLGEGVLATLERDLSTLQNPEAQRERRRYQPTFTAAAAVRRIITGEPGSTTSRESRLDAERASRRMLEGKSPEVYDGPEDIPVRVSSPHLPLSLPIGNLWPFLRKHATDMDDAALMVHVVALEERVQRGEFLGMRTVGDFVEYMRNVLRVQQEAEMQARLTDEGC